jgi:hypothetical protein
MLAGGSDIRTKLVARSILPTCHISGSLYHAAETFGICLLASFS